jgi:hypothetical protein
VTRRVSPLLVTSNTITRKQKRKETERGKIKKKY